MICEYQSAKQEGEIGTVEEKACVSVLDLDAIPLPVWEAWGEETARFIRRLLRDPDIRAELMAAAKGGEKT